MKSKNSIVLCMSMLIFVSAYADLDPEQARIIAQLRAPQEPSAEQKGSSLKERAWQAAKIAGAVALASLIVYNLPVSKTSPVKLPDLNVPPKSPRLPTLSAPEVPVLPTLPYTAPVANVSSGVQLPQKAPFMDYAKASKASVFFATWLFFVQESSMMLFPLASPSPIVAILMAGYGLSAIGFMGKAVADSLTIKIN